MKIGPSIPMHVARAYGVQQPARTVQPRPAAAPNPLVAATVDQPVNFDAAPASASGPTLPLYTRAADKVEAAVSVMMGRTIDVRG